MKIERIEAPLLREPFMWNIVGVSANGGIHVERVHADWIRNNMPEVGGYIVNDAHDGLHYQNAARFERNHSPKPAEVPDINPLAGKVWRGPHVGTAPMPNALRYDRDNPFGFQDESAAAPMESGAMPGVDIDKAHGRADWQS